MALQLDSFVIRTFKRFVGFTTPGLPAEHLPELVVAPRASPWDPLILAVACARPVAIFGAPGLRLQFWQRLALRLLKSEFIEHVDNQDPAAQVAAILGRSAGGYLCCIFAYSAAMSHITPVEPGKLELLAWLGLPVRAAQIDYRGYALGKGALYGGIIVSFAPTLLESDTPGLGLLLYQSLKELEAGAHLSRNTDCDLLHRQFIRTARRHKTRLLAADSTGKELSGIKLLTGALILAGYLKKSIPADQERVGIMLPASIGGVLVNIAVAVIGRVAVNINFTSSQADIDHVLQECQIETIYTSRVFIHKANLPARDEMVYLEDVMPLFGSLERIRALVMALVAPIPWLEEHFAPGKIRHIDEVATIIYSSGSTGRPKGIVLSYRNIVANIESILQGCPLRPTDCFMAVLPLFHSFGYTVTMWLPLTTGFQVVYHPNPTDAKAIAKLINMYQATVMIATPTFYKIYLSKFTKADFSSLRYVIAGAEKMTRQLFDAYQQKFGIIIYEGYGCTEMSPAVAINVPDLKASCKTIAGQRFGSVGRPLPGVSAKVLPLDKSAALKDPAAGMLALFGANMTSQYYLHPQQTAAAIQGGWYITGDIAKIDAEGFIHILDRLARFSKIGGEMISHLSVEEELLKHIDQANIVVSCASCAKKGEQLVVLYDNRQLNIRHIWSKLQSSGLSKLAVPKLGNFYHIDEIPILGTGKLDLSGVKKLAQSLTS